MAYHELRVVSAGIDVKFMRNTARRQELVQHLRSLLEAVIVIVADIEIDLHTFQAGRGVGTREVKHIVAIEVRG